jgi:hypothetical protein
MEKKEKALAGRPKMPEPKTKETDNFRVYKLEGVFGWLVLFINPKLLGCPKEHPIWHRILEISPCQRDYRDARNSVFQAALMEIYREVMCKLTYLDYKEEDVDDFIKYMWCNELGYRKDGVPCLDGTSGIYLAHIHYDCVYPEMEKASPMCSSEEQAWGERFRPGFPVMEFNM